MTVAMKRYIVGTVLVLSIALFSGLTACEQPAQPPATSTPPPTYTPYPTAKPAPTYTPYPTAKPAPTYTPYPTATPAPTYTPYPTATPAPTYTPPLTATPLPTYTPYPTRTRTPRPNATATPPPLDLGAPNYGPTSGAIPHDPSDGKFASVEGPSLLGQVVIEATFHNPDVPHGGRWQHGFLLRKAPANVFHAIRINHDGSWEHAYRLGTGRPTPTLRREASTAIDTTPAGRNRLRLVVVETDGSLFINDELQGRLDLSAVRFDRVRLHVTNETEGAVTRYENFMVREWDQALEGRSASDATPTAKSEIYLHSSICPDAPSYEFVVPQGWVESEVDCSYIEYFHRSDHAWFSVEVLERSGYSRDPDAAINELIEDYESWEYFDPEDGVTSTNTITSSVRTEHNGDSAVLMTLTRTHDSLDYCRETAYFLLVLSKSWVDGDQRLLEVWGAYCDHRAEQYRPDVEAMLDTFRLVEPY